MGIASCSKIFLYILNTIFLILGITILGLGIWAYIDGAQYSITPTVAIGVMVLGGFVFLVSFFGCLGAFKASKCLLITYSIIIALLLIALLAIGIAAFVNPDLVSEYASKAWEESTNDTRSVIEDTFDCCGFYNTTDRPANGTCPNNATACRPAIEAKIETYFNAIAGVGFTIVAVMLFSIIFALILACKGRED